MSDPLDLGVSQIPMPVFVVVHLAIFAVTGFFAIRAFSNQKPQFGAGMGLLAVAELVYLLYHFELTTFLLSHTVAEVLVLLAAISFFLGFRD